jgi:3-deoxy-7-phosphoheptulonate synthase
MDEPGANLVAEYADCIQIGARNMQNYSSKVVGRSLLKRGERRSTRPASAEYILAEEMGR